MIKLITTLDDTAFGKLMSMVKNDGDRVVLRRVREILKICSLVPKISFIDRLFGVIAVSANTEDCLKTITSQSGELLGKDGVSLKSKSVKQDIVVDKTKYRIDIENPSPNKLPANLHIQVNGVSKSPKYYFNPVDKKLYVKIKTDTVDNFILADKSVQKILDNLEIQKNINKGLTTFLSEPKAY